MQVRSLDHVNIRTSNLARMVAWYEEVLGFRKGPRPPFDFGGAWLYCGDSPVVHLVEVKTQPKALEPALEHAAFGAEGLDAFLAHLDGKGIGYRIGVTPGFDITQVNVFDPDGNHLHVDFGPHEKR